MVILYNCAGLQELLQEKMLNMVRIGKIISSSTIITLLVLVMLFIIASQFFEFGGTESQTVSAKPCVPTFPDGDGPYYQFNSPLRNKLVPDNADGERLVVKGKVLKSDCETAVNNVILDIWQADAMGNYQTDWYRGKVAVSEDGSYEFETVVPKGYGEGTGYRPPHIHFKVELNNQVIITSEMFFPDVKGKEGFNDAYIVQLSDTLSLDGNYKEAYHDIILP